MKRLDMIALSVLVGGMLALLAGIAQHGFNRPRPTALAPLPSGTPAPTATAGWWERTTLTPPALKKLPGVPTVSLASAAARGAQSAQPVAFGVVSCPQPTVKITQIVTAGRNVWNVYGTATIPNLEYWKGEISADGKNWTSLYRSATPVAAGLLIEFNTSTVPKGGYQMRLLAVDKTGNYGAPCVVSITTP
jgi:hypothetical protein